MNNFPAMTEEQRQKMISDCQAEIVEIEKALTTWGEGWISYLQSKLTRQKIALAALTAEKSTLGEIESGIRALKMTLTKCNRINYCRGVLMNLDDVVAKAKERTYTAPPVPVLKRNNEKLAREIVCRLVDVGEANPEVVDVHQAWVLNKLNGVK